VKRRVVQLALAALFVAWVAWPERVPVGDRFFHLDWLTGGLASLTQVIPYAVVLGLGLLLLTFLWGRVFCGWACPLGTLTDFIDWLTGQPVRARARARLKLYLLLLLAPATVGGAVVLWFLDPFVLGSRIATLLSPSVAEPLVALAVLVAFGAIEIALGRRGFCRVLCPLGAALGAVARISTFRRTVTDACTDCGDCVAGCRMAAIGPTSKEYDRGECIHCGDCHRGCAATALSFDYRIAEARPTPARPRRSTLVALAGGAATFAVARIGLARIERPRRLRPPGTVDEERLATLCVRCGSCVRVCPTHTLVSSTAPVLDPTFFTPELVARLGGCALDCNACGRSCPSGAIEDLALEAKRRHVIGQAKVRAEHCLAHQGRACLACVAACPFEAIQLTDTETFTEWGDAVGQPIIDAQACTGCGLCEALCPVVGDAAIEVVPGQPAASARSSAASE